MAVTTVFESSNPLSAKKMAEIEHSEVRCDWSGLALPRGLRWSIARDPERVWFSIELPVPASEPARHRPGEFVEGLWDFDVAEVFFMAPSGRYQEWNMSSDGAWWAMSFIGYRERAGGARMPSGVEVQVFSEAESWCAIVSLPHASLGVELRDLTRVHVSGIIYSGGASPRYLSSAGTPSFEPDFHDSRCFEAISFKSI